MVGVPNHLNWITFSKNLSNSQYLLRVITYINIRLLNLHFSLCKDIFDHRDISCISFFNCSSIYFLINVCSDSSQIALKYLKNTKANMNNILIMIGNFNIRNSFWNPLFLNHLIYSDILTDIADSLNLCISSTTIQVPIKYVDNLNDSNSVIDLMFLQLNSDKFDNHIIYLDWRLLSDHALLIVKISIFEEHIQTRK